MDRSTSFAGPYLFLALAALAGTGLIVYLAGSLA
jgi:hypothetical protein